MPDSATPWTAARQASLSITSSWSLLKLMFIEFVMPSNHLILCHPLLLSPSVLEGCTVIADDCDILVYWYGRSNPFISHIWPVCCGSHCIIILEFGLNPWRSRLLAYVQRFSFSFFFVHENFRGNTFVVMRINLYFKQSSQSRLWESLTVISILVGKNKLRSKEMGSVQLLSHVQLFATPWTAVCQASLSITNSWSFLKLKPL